MTKHTPGPWHANAIANGRIIGDADATGAEKIQINNSNATIATVYRPKDALLIAAAPELLDAAKKALDFIHSLPYEPSIASSTKAQDSLVATIAKAEGGAQ